MGVYKDVIENGVFEFFANSFLVECSDDGHLGRVTFSCFSTERKEKYRIATLFTDEGKVEKLPLNETEGAAHIWQCVKNGLALQKAGKNVLPMQLKNGRLVSDFVQGQSLEERVLAAVKRKNKFEVCRILDQVYQEILSSSQHIAAEENIFYTMEIDKEVNADKYGPILKVGFIDMILRNAFYIDGNIQWFDQEWVLECVPAGYVFYRLLIALYQFFPYVDKVAPIVEIAQKYGVLAAWQEYRKMEELFADMVVEEAHVLESNVYRGVDRTACLNNIQKLLGILP